MIPRATVYFALVTLVYFILVNVFFQWMLLYSKTSKINLELRLFEILTYSMNYFNICLQKYMIWVCEETSH